MDHVILCQKKAICIVKDRIDHVNILIMRFRNSAKNYYLHRRNDLEYELYFEETRLTALQEMRKQEELSRDAAQSNDSEKQVQ